MLAGKRCGFALAYALLMIGLISSAHAACQLNSPSGKLKQIVYVEFDNVISPATIRMSLRIWSRCPIYLTSLSRTGRLTPAIIQS